MAKSKWLRFAEILAVGQAFQPDGIICRLESLTCVTLAWTRLLIDRNGLPSGGAFPVQAPDRAPERWTWSTRSEGGRQLARAQRRRKPDRVEIPNMCWTCGSLVS